jgi:hypothetical protein
MHTSELWIFRILFENAASESGRLRIPHKIADTSALEAQGAVLNCTHLGSVWEVVTAPAAMEKQNVSKNKPCNKKPCVHVSAYVCMYVCMDQAHYLHTFIERREDQSVARDTNTPRGETKLQRIGPTCHTLKQNTSTKTKCSERNQNITRGNRHTVLRNKMQRRKPKHNEGNQDTAREAQIPHCNKSAQRNRPCKDNLAVTTLCPPLPLCREMYFQRYCDHCSCGLMDKAPPS